MRAALFDSLQVCRDRQPRGAALNMAIDEALLERARGPVLRFYGWANPAVSFGYFGSFDEVAQAYSGRELVRRWTGGGMVPHGQDLTYTIVMPAGSAAAHLRAAELYRRIHGALCAACARVGPIADVSLAEQASPKISDACFANPVPADVLLRGRKIAGAAQRRTRAGVLHQGSIQAAELPADFAGMFAEALCAQPGGFDLPDDLLARARMISAEKYGTEEWLRRR